MRLPLPGSLPLLGLATVLLAACGGSSEPKAQRPAAPAATKVRITATQPEPGRYAFEVASSAKAGIVELQLDNRDELVREAQLIRVGDGHTIEEALSDEGDDPSADWLEVSGGVPETAPGATGTSIQELRAGTYYVVDPGSEGDDPRQFYEQGAVARFDVGPAGVPGDLPDAPARIEITRRAPGMIATGLEPGANEVLIENDGPHYNGVAIIPILPGYTLADVQRHLESSGSAGSPLDEDASMSTPLMEAAVPGQVTRQVARLDLPPGRYALTSYIAPAEGESFAAKGWVTEVATWGPPLSKEDFIAKGDAVCAAFARERDAAEEAVGTIDSNAQLIRLDRAGIPASEKFLAAFDALQPPDAEGQALKERLLGQARKRLVATRARIAATKTGSPVAIGRANVALEAIRTPIVSDYGFQECGPGKGG